MKFNSAWKTADIGEVMAFSESYKAFLDKCKTERECVSFFEKGLKDAGFSPLEDRLQKGEPLVPGSRVYYVRGNKAIAAFIVGNKEPREGIRFITAHLDSPRLDIRMNPLKDAGEFLQMKTYYYGGIKKYQWVAQPLALHGVVVKKDGSTVPVVCGEDAAEPVLYISDLPHHLSQEQLQKPAKDAIDGEMLTLMAGSVGETENIRENTLHILKEKYHMGEEDFVSAELEAVPAGKARDVGFDKGLISAYGQDDRICAYTAYRAFIEAEVPEKTIGLLLVDKEEVGSQADTGMNSHLMEYAVSMLLRLTAHGEIFADDVFAHSQMLSADVCLGYDPLHPEAFEESNSCHLGYGPVLLKYAGHGGKKNTNDASAEYMGWLRSLLDHSSVTWQIGEMGRIDFGGGSTIAPFSARYGVETVDMGIALLSMHAPYELSSKADIYEAYRAYSAFYRGR